MSGNARGPSTAFNLLYRLGQVCGSVVSPLLSQLKWKQLMMLH